MLDKAQLQKRQGRNKQAEVTTKARRRCIFRKYTSIALETVLKLFGDLLIMDRLESHHINTVSKPSHLGVEFKDCYCILFALKLTLSDRF